MFTGCPVDEMIMEGDEVKGVVLSKHAIFPEAEVRARRAVVSNLSCHPTFLGLIGEEKLPDWVKEGVDTLQERRDRPLHQLLGPRQAPPLGGLSRGDQQAYGFNFGLESVEDVRRLEHCLENDELPDPPIVAGLSVQGFALADPTQAPKGQYTVMAWSNVPYKLPQLAGRRSGTRSARATATRSTTCCASTTRE